METQTRNQDTQYYRFQVFHGEPGREGKIAKTRSVGMSYLRDGQNIFTLRLWMFVNERFYLIPSKEDAAKFLVMTREPNRSLTAKNKYFWNIVGNGHADSEQGVITLNFDLLERPIYMNIFPEASAHSSGMAMPEELKAA